MAEAIGDTGLLVPPKDPSAVAAACVQLLSDKRRRRALGRAARSRVLQHFDVKRCFATYLGLYEELAGNELGTIDLRDLKQGEIAEPAESVLSYRPAALQGSSLKVRPRRFVKPGVIG